MKTIVLTYSIKQFHTFLYENRVEEKDKDDYRYADSAHSIQGIRADRVIIYGTFWDRQDAQELYKLANSRVMK